MNMPLLVGGLPATSAMLPCGSAVLGYVGPAGIGALGVLLVVAAVLLVGVIGLVLYPVRLFLKSRRRRRALQADGETRPREAQEKA